MCVHNPHVPHISVMPPFLNIVLRTLKWNVHPPTSLCFTRYLLYLLPYSSITLDARHATLELSRFLTELSVMDFFFVPYRASTVALAAILNSMDSIPTVPPSAQLMFAANIQHATNMNPHSLEVNECRARLRLHYQQGGYAPPAQIENEIRDTSISPVCVTQGITEYHDKQVPAHPRQDHPQHSN